MPCWGECFGKCKLRSNESLLLLLLLFIVIIMYFYSSLFLILYLLMLEICSDEISWSIRSADYYYTENSEEHNTRITDFVLIISLSYYLFSLRVLTSQHLTCTNSHISHRVCYCFIQFNYFHKVRSIDNFTKDFVLWGLDARGIRWFSGAL